MLIEYENDSIRKIFEDHKLMRKKVGDRKTRAIKKRLDQLQASSNFNIYLTTGLGRPHQLTGNLAGYYAINITANIRLVVRPDTENLESDRLKECETIIIKGVMDYHGKKINWFIP